MLIFSQDFSNGSAIKNPPAVQETKESWVPSLVREDPLEEEMATHSTILAWEIPWTEKPGGLQSVGSRRGGHTEQHMGTHTHMCTHTHIQIYLFKDKMKKL